MLKNNQKQQLGVIEGEDPMIVKYIKKQVKVPVDFKHDYGYNPMNPDENSLYDSNDEESIDFIAEEERMGKETPEVGE